MSKIPVNLTHGYLNQNPKCRGKWPQKGSWPLESVQITSNNSNLKLNLALFLVLIWRDLLRLFQKLLSCSEWFGQKTRAHPLLLHPPPTKEKRTLSVLYLRIWILFFEVLKWQSSIQSQYDKVADVPESWVWWRAVFQNGSRVLKKVFWTFSYLYLYLNLLKTLTFWKSLNSFNKSGSRPQN